MSHSTTKLPSLIRVFAVGMKKAWILGYPLSTQRRLIRMGTLGKPFCWFCLAMAHMIMIYSSCMLCYRHPGFFHFWVG